MRSTYIITECTVSKIGVCALIRALSTAATDHHLSTSRTTTKAELGVALLQDQRMPVNVLLLQLEEPARDRQCVGSNACSKGASNQRTVSRLQQSYLVLSHMVSQQSWPARRCSRNIFLLKDYSWLSRGL